MRIDEHSWIEEPPGIERAFHRSQSRGKEFWPFLVIPAAMVTPNGVMMRNRPPAVVSTASAAAVLIVQNCSSNADLLPRPLKVVTRSHSLLLTFSAFSSILLNTRISSRRAYGTRSETSL